jgi:hypothetical protein
MSIQPYNSSNYNDILLETFIFLDPKENIQIATVCKTWSVFAIKAFKIHFIAKAEQDLNQKMAYMLLMTGKKVSDYCSTLEELFVDREKFSLKEIYKCSTNLTKKHTVFLNGFGVVYMEPNCFEPLLEAGMKSLQGGNLTQEAIQHISAKMAVINLRKNSICGRGFLGLTLKNHILERIFCNGEPSGCIVTRTILANWRCEGIRFFPIELFNVKIQGEKKEVIQTDEAKDFCLFLGGKLIEIIVIDEQLWEISEVHHNDDHTYWRSTSPMLAKIPIPEEIVDSYPVESFYIPELDSIPIINSPHHPHKAFPL